MSTTDHPSGREAGLRRLADYIARFNTRGGNRDTTAGGDEPATRIDLQPLTFWRSLRLQAITLGRSMRVHAVLLYMAIPLVGAGIMLAFAHGSAGTSALRAAVTAVAVFLMAAMLVPLGLGKWRGAAELFLAAVLLMAAYQILALAGVA